MSVDDIKLIFESLSVFHPDSLPLAAPDREQLKIELQQVTQQINQQTQIRTMEVSVFSN